MFIPKLGMTLGNLIRGAVSGGVPELLFAYNFEDINGSYTDDATGYFPRLIGSNGLASGVSGYCPAQTSGSSLQETSDPIWATINQSQNFSMSLWAKAQTGAGFPYGGDGRTLMITGDNQTICQISGPGASAGINATFIGKSSNHVPGDTNWHHLVFTYDAATKEVTEYYDGGAGSSLGTVSVDFTCTGWSHTMYTYYDTIRGVDEIYGWSVVLTAQEAADLWNSGSGVFYPSIPRA